jgi:hypothetical protein
MRAVTLMGGMGISRSDAQVAGADLADFMDVELRPFPGHGEARLEGAQPIAAKPSAATSRTWRPPLRNR